MRVASFFYILFFGHFAFSQENIVCTGNAGQSVSCQSSTSLSQIAPVTSNTATSIPANTVPNANFILVPAAAGKSISITTTPLAPASNLWVTIQNTEPVSLNLDLSSKANSSSDAPTDASNVVLTAGRIDGLTLNISGYTGASTQNFSEKCASDISKGVFGNDALQYFISSRLANPNLPQDRCLPADLSWLGLHPDVSDGNYCAGGTSDIGDDNDLTPIFKLTKYANKNKCLMQNDTRPCAVVGYKYKCAVKIYYTRQGKEFGSGLSSVGADGGYGLPDPTTVRSKSGHPVTLIYEFHTWDNSPGSCSFGTNLTGSCQNKFQTVYVVAYVRYEDSTFFLPTLLDTTLSNSLNDGGAELTPEANQYCQGFLGGTAGANPPSTLPADLYIDIRSGSGPTLFPDGYLSLNPDLHFGYTGMFSAVTDMTPINDSPSLINPTPPSTTTNQLCETYATNTYNTSLQYTDPNYGRNVLSITTEPALTSARSYEYVDGACPVGENLVANDQLHFNLNWTTTISCSSGGCPGGLFMSYPTNSALQVATLSKPQSGAEHGKAVVFAYDIGTLAIQNSAGKDGTGGLVDITIPATIKNCATIKDLDAKNPADQYLSQARIPTVLLNQVTLTPYSILAPDVTQSRIYDTSYYPYVYKKIDSSVRAWVNSLAGH